MLRTANQRIAALVLVGGVILLVYLLWITLLQNVNLGGAWFTFNLVVSAVLTNHEVYTLSSTDPDSQVSIAVMVIFILSYISGCLLASHTLLMSRRKAGRAIDASLFQRISSVLILLSGAISVGYLLWYLNYTFSNLVLAWLNINFIVVGQLSSSVIVEPDMYDNVVVRAANVVMAALAFSYALCVVLAIATLRQRWRASITTTE